MNGLNFSQVIFALNQTLNQHENIRRGRLRSKLTTDDLISHYNCGNLNEIIFNQDTINVNFEHSVEFDNFFFLANQFDILGSFAIE